MPTLFLQITRGLGNPVVMQVCVYSGTSYDNMALDWDTDAVGDTVRIETQRKILSTKTR